VTTSRPLAMAHASATVMPLLDQAVLTPQERGRAREFGDPAARADFVAAHLLARLCAARFLGLSPESMILAQHCQGCGAEDHGRPFLPDHPHVGVSLSHTRGAVAAAAGPGAVGIDVEVATRARFEPRLARRILTAAEFRAVQAAPDPARTMLRHWVRKEAMVKVGAVSLGTMRHLDVGSASGGSAVAGWHVLDWSIGDLYVSVAARRPSTMVSVDLTPGAIHA